MNTDPRSIIRVLPVLLAVLAVPLLPVAAQEAEGDQEDTGLGTIIAEFETWVAQPSGLEYHPTTVFDRNDPFGTRVLNTTHGTQSEMRYRGGYELSNNLGALVFTWYSHEDDEAGLRLFRPGDFVYGEILAHPLFAGYQNDGLADGFQSATDTTLRDFRIDFYRTAFRTGRAIGKWFAGYRRVQHLRGHEISYFGLVPDFPPLVPPVSDPQPQLAPLPDVVSLESRYKGRGIEGGMDFLIPLWRDRVSIEAGFAVAVLRGKVSSDYRSTTHFYLSDVPNQDPEILFPPYDELDDIIFVDIDNDPGTPPVPFALAEFVTQETVQIGLNTESRSQSGDVAELYLGVRWRATKNLQIFGGFRNTSYSSVGIDLRPVIVTDTFGLNVEDVTETDRSATYEGFYGGVGVRF